MSGGDGDERAGLDPLVDRAHDERTGHDRPDRDRADDRDRAHDEPTGHDRDRADGDERADLDRLVDRADLDELVRAVETLTAGRDWPSLLALRTKCRYATGTGRQLWPVASLVEYRVALEGPAEFAACVLTPDAGRFTIGPLTEVAASSHRWDELAPHLEPGAVITAFVAHERVLRGDVVLDDERVDAAVLDVPLALAAWEPAYPLASYRPDGADFPSPPLPTPTPTAATRRAKPTDDQPALDALRAVVEPWHSSSNGRIDTVAVEGDAAGAVAELGVGSMRMAELSAGDALAWLAWAGASGGAHGRRRGTASGRFGAWWALAALAGLSAEWPVPADELGDAAAELRWFWWDAGDPVTGWQLRLAVTDPAEGLAWAMSAVDDA